MRIIVKSAFFPFLALLCCITACSKKEDTSVKQIAPLLKENTFLVVHVDATKINDASFNPVEKRLTRLMDKMATRDPETMTAEEKTQTIDQFKKFRGDFSATLHHLQQEKIGNFFIVNSLEEMQTYPNIVAFETASRPSESFDSHIGTHMGQLNAAGAFDKFHIYAKAGGFAEPINEETAGKIFGTNPPVERPEIHGGFAATDAAPVRILVAFPPGLKSMAKMLLGLVLMQVPPESGITAESVGAALDGLETWIMTVDPAKERLTVRINATSPEKAREIDALFGKFIDLALERMREQATGDQAKKDLEATRSLAAELKPKLEGKSLVALYDGKLLDKYEDRIVEAGLANLKAQKNQSPFAQPGGADMPFGQPRPEPASPFTPTPAAP